MVLGQHQCENTTESAGLALMGVRPYTSGRGLFTAVDTVLGGNETSYGYPNDPVGGLDLAGRRYIYNVLKRYSSSNRGWIYEVYPSLYARYASLNERWFAWWEAVRRGVPNMGKMKDQFLCHYDLVRIRAPRKVSWNLDMWRRDVSYAATLWASCNP